MEYLVRATPDIIAQLSATTRCFNLLVINLFTLIHVCARLFGRSQELRTEYQKFTRCLSESTQRREQGGVSRE